MSVLSTVYEYDAAGQLERATRPDGLVTTICEQNRSGKDPGDWL